MLQVQVQMACRRCGERALEPCPCTVPLHRRSLLEPGLLSGSTVVLMTPTGVQCTSTHIFSTRVHVAFYIPWVMSYSVTDLVLEWRKYRWVTYLQEPGVLSGGGVGPDYVALLSKQLLPVPDYCRLMPPPCAESEPGLELALRADWDAHGWAHIVAMLGLLDTGGAVLYWSTMLVGARAIPQKDVANKTCP